jgi:hypothetical protein
MINLPSILKVSIFLEPLLFFLAVLGLPECALGGTDGFSKKVCGSVTVTVQEADVPNPEKVQFHGLVRQQISELERICAAEPNSQKLIKSKKWKKVIFRGTPESEYSQSGCALIDSGVLDCVYYRGELDSEKNSINYLSGRTSVEVND